jgi:hypothetical protein
MTKHTVWKQLTLLGAALTLLLGFGAAQADPPDNGLPDNGLPDNCAHRHPGIVVDHCCR